MFQYYIFLLVGSIDSRGTSTEPTTAHPCSAAQTKNMKIFKVFFWYKKLTPINYTFIIYIKKVQKNKSNIVVVIGAQWGDEGKGKIVDWLTDEVAAVVRFQGGHNAGHTLVIDGEKDGTACDSIWHPA